MAGLAKRDHVTTVGIHHENLRASGREAVKGDFVAVRRPQRIMVRVLVVSELLDPGPVGIHHEDLSVAVRPPGRKGATTKAFKGDLFAVG